MSGAMPRLSAALPIREGAVTSRADDGIGVRSAVGGEPESGLSRRFIRPSRGDGLVGAGSVKSPQRGFTLIEVLLATVLLATGLALAFATLRASTATVERGEALAQRSERMRAVEGFLRRRLASAQPIGFAIDP